MSELNITLGKWRVVDRTVNARTVNITWPQVWAGGTLLADVFAPSEARPGELWANARAMAAVPKLLAACQEIEQWLADARGPLEPYAAQRGLDAVRAALAEAGVKP